VAEKIKVPDIALFLLVGMLIGPAALGWVNMGMAVTELTFPEGVCRVMGAPKQYSWLVRSLGLRELAIGLGLLLQPQRRAWVWARVVGDAMDMALLAASFRLPRANRAWQGTLTAATLVSAVGCIGMFGCVPEI